MSTQTKEAQQQEQQGGQASLTGWQAGATGQRRAIEEKCRLYLDTGVEGVWICEKDGTLRFCNADGVIETLRVAEAAPGRISTDIYP